jgi:uncharacterized protein
MAGNTSKRGLASADEETKQRVASQGGQASGGNFANDPQRASEAGQKGGQAVQQSGNAHELTEEDRGKGGSMSGGNFANDPQRASEAGKKGGSR